MTKRGSRPPSRPGRASPFQEEDRVAEIPEKIVGYRRTSYAVWEITLACNLACGHCGSRAGDARVNELSTEEAFDLIHQMAECGIGEVTMIGGEAFLRPDWLELAKEINNSGMVCTMTTGGYGVSLETARRMKAAGIARVSVSIDGLEDTHDFQRGKKGAFKSAFKTMGHLQEVGVLFGCNTQINRLSAPELPRILEAIRDAGSSGWQLQMTVPMGNAADNASWLLQPAELLDLYPVLARVVRRANADGVTVLSGNNIGYYGPYETLLRSAPGDENAMWMGCQAGLYALGIEADGAIKGCPSLPTKAYTGGNIRDRPLREILETKELLINMGGGTAAGEKHLWGFCKSCEHRHLCRGGCSWTAHVFFDKRGNNPYCHHRALELQKIGKRERVVPKLMAIGEPFDNGVFKLIVEPSDKAWPDGDPLRFTKDKVVWPDGWDAWPFIEDGPPRADVVKSWLEVLKSNGTQSS
jgi:nif11-class peptide radical SAM maturase 3